MIQKTKTDDFIELEFIGRANGEIFDTNIKEDADKLNLEINKNPLIVCVGQKMVVESLDKALEGKEIGKNYKIKIPPGTDFGERKKELVKTIPLKVFTEKKINPEPGITLALDNLIVKIIAVSGGRVIADFNNPLAGKEVEYDFTIKRTISDTKEKINSLQNFFFRQNFDFKIEDKKIVFEKKAEPFLNHFREQFKKILDLEFIIETKNKKESKPLQK